MSRLRKCRRVCCMPAILRFTPDCQQAEYLALSVDEIESLRLCDLEGLEQDEAAAVMEVSRGTFQRILYSAHKKTAEALCEGKGTQWYIVEHERGGPDPVGEVKRCFDALKQMGKV